MFPRLQALDFQTEPQIFLHRSKKNLKCCGAEIILSLADEQRGGPAQATKGLGQ
jgi:hypothetical protein